MYVVEMTSDGFVQIDTGVQAIHMQIQTAR
jgi:hypothetical protein